MSAISAGYAQGFLISKTIQTTVKGVEVEGHIEGSSFDINITITKPFKNICDSWHIPYFAKGHMSYDGKYGERRAQQSLTSIYRLAKYIVRKEEMLKRKYQEFEEKKSELSEGGISEGEFKLKKRLMRKQLKSGEIPNRVYQQRIGSMRREVESLNRNIWRLEDSFFEAYFPMSVFGSMRGSVMDILGGKKSLV